MQTTFKVIICFLLLYSFGVSCADKNKDCADTSLESQAPLNPNGDSELALLMRAMFAEAEQIKQQIAGEEAVSISLDHEKILTAHATEPEKAASSEYKAFAKAYLTAIDELKTASPDQQLYHYENMVDNCMACHKALCPGPTVRIQKLQ
jgi:hypothetical protein